MREYTPWDYVKPGIAIAAFAVGLIFVLFRFDAVSKVGGVLFNAVSSFILGLFIAYILNVFLNLFENTVFGRLTRSDNKVWKKLKRPVCVALSYAVIVLILLAITLYVVPEIFKSLELIGETARVNIPVYVDQIAKWADELSKQFDLNHWVDMRRALVTQQRHKDASVDIDASAFRLLAEVEGAAETIFVGQGFIGGAPDGTTTTLGREGSDYSAAVVANILGAESMSVWKDVDGVLNADPKTFPDAEQIKELNYLDTIELAYSGAQIIHPKTIKPLQNKNIPLYVRPFGDKRKPGTVSV